MSRRKITKIEGQWIGHLREMRQSVVWKLLKHPERLILDRLEEEHMAHGGRENGNLQVTFAGFEKAGVRRASAAASIAKLEALLLVECTARGKRSYSDVRIPSSYRLTYLPTKDAAPSHDWRKIRSLEDAQARIAHAAADLEARTAPLSRTLKQVHADRKATPEKAKSLVAESLPKPVAKTLPNDQFPGSENATHVPVAKTLLTSISRVRWQVGPLPSDPVALAGWLREVFPDGREAEAAIRMYRSGELTHEMIRRVVG